MSDQTHYPPLPTYDTSRNVGIMYVDELGPDGVPFRLKLYSVPAEALSLVKPTQVVGIGIRELHDASPEVQCLVLEAWFRLNHEPAPPEVYARHRERLFSPQITFDACFTAQELDGLREGLARLWPKLAAEARIWLQKPPEPRDVHRQNALDALDKLEAAIRQGGPDTPGPGHNRPPGPLDGKPVTLDDGRREALVAVQDSRRELLAERPNFEVLRRSAQTIIKLARIAAGIVSRAAHTTWPTVKKVAGGAASVVIADAYANGSDAAIAHVAALWHTGVNAATALQAFIGSL